LGNLQPRVWQATKSDLVIRIFSIAIPKRVLALLASEASTVMVLLLGVVPLRQDHEWIWLRYEGGFGRILLATGIFLLCMYYYNLYDSLVAKSLRESLTRLPEVLGTVYLALAAVYLLFPDLRLHLASVLLGVAVVGLAIAVVRRAYIAIVGSTRLAEPYVLVGTGALRCALEAEIRNRPELGIRLVDAWPERGAEVREGSSAQKRAWEVIPKQSVGVILAGEHRTGGLAERWEKSGRMVIEGQELYQTVTGKLWLDSFFDQKQQVPGTRWLFAVQLAGARLIAVLASLLLLVLVAPLMAAIAGAIRLDSAGPVIFRQRRVGQHGGIFTLYKFRSMHTNQSGPFRPTQPSDPRLTRVGAWLRRTRLDELPQLWNIFCGDMAFVGPRPVPREEEEQWNPPIPFHSLRWSVKPGVTGWAQVHLGYCATREDSVERLAYDLFYIKNLSVGLDLLILFQTTKILLQGHGAR
jgi:exopolysaccharide biosynthesis polyprenyl glycosylphosphotransferase